MILHKKRVATNRPDTADPTIAHGIAHWDADHLAPDFLAYAATMSSSVQLTIPKNNLPDTEIPNLRSKYDFTYVTRMRIVVGCDYGSMKIFFKYSRDLKTWASFDGVGGPFITQTQGNQNPVIYASAFTSIVDDAKADVFVAPFMRENTDVSIVKIATLMIYIR